MRVLREESIRRGVSMERAIESQRAAFAALHQSDSVHIPQRVIADTAHGPVLFKPFVGARNFGLKVVSVRQQTGVQGVVLLLDSESGLPVALMSALYITALRTAAGSAVAADLLLPKTNKEKFDVCCFGAGLQIECHVLALAAVRPLGRVFVVNRTFEKAAAMVQKLREHEALKTLQIEAIPQEKASNIVQDCSIIVTATSATEPLFEGGAKLKEGTFIAAVGSYTVKMRELDDATVQRAQIVADLPDEVYETSGDINGVVDRKAILASLGELVCEESARAKFHVGKGVILFKSIGNAVQDLFIANAALEALGNEAQIVEL